MAFSNENCPASVSIELGTISAAKTSPAIYFPKKVVLVSAQLVNGANVAEQAGSSLKLEVKDQADALVGSIDTAVGAQGALTANVGKALALSQTQIPAGTSLKAVYSEIEGVAEVTRITVPSSMVGADLHQKGFLIHDEVGSVDVWFDVDNAGGTEPTNLNAAGARAIEVSTVSAADDASEIAAALAAALDADAKFLAVVDPQDPESVLVTASLVGLRTDASDGLTTEASGLEIEVETQGVAAVTQALTNAKLVLNYFIP